MWVGAICPLQVPFDKIFLVFTVIIIILTILTDHPHHHPHHLDHQPVRVNEEEGAAEAIDPLLETQPKPRRCWTKMSHRPSGCYRHLNYYQNNNDDSYQDHHDAVSGEAALPQDHQRAPQLRCQVLLNNPQFCERHHKKIDHHHNHHNR